MKRTAKEVDSILESWLEEHKKKRNSGMVKGDEDFMGVMLSVLHKNLPGYDADTVNKSTCLGFLTGGTGTSTVTLTWALSLLLNNRQALEKIQKELDIHIGRERQVEESDIKNLVYLASRQERFLTTHKDVNVRGQHFELLPFSSGRRMCPGITLAHQMNLLTRAILLHGFEFATISNESVDMSLMVPRTIRSEQSHVAGEGTSITGKEWVLDKYNECWRGWKHTLKQSCYDPEDPLEENLKVPADEGLYSSNSAWSFDCRSSA
ncbi:hypothetical protein L1049_005344 [Liquidambar formosana]|uniref:Cytochrome P450 n=1 Tax=Liquidambar formosana TaxID=63359 RepID=A0AAP0WXK9_LIQFO